MGSLHFTFIECITYIIIGYVYKLAMIRTPAQRGQIRIISKLVIQVIVPVLIFRNLVGMKALPSESWVDMVVFIALEILAGIAGLLIYHKLDYTKWVTLYVTMFGFNTGVFFYPILEQIVGAEGIANMIMFDIPNNLVIFILYPMLFLYVKAKTGGDEAHEIEPPDESKSIPLDKIKSPVLRSTSSTPGPSSSPAPLLTRTDSASSGTDGSRRNSSSIDMPVNGPVLTSSSSFPDHKSRKRHSNKSQEKDGGDGGEGESKKEDKKGKKEKEKKRSGSESDGSDESDEKKGKKGTVVVIEDEIENVLEHMGEEVIDIVQVGDETKEVTSDSVTVPYYVSPNMKKKEIATKILKSIFMNGPFLSIVFSFICFGAGLKLPTWIDNLLEKISRTLTFIGMALMGMLLDLHPRLVIKNIKWVGITMLTRYAVGAVVAVFNYFVVFPYISPATRVIAFLGPFMPAPIMASVFVIDNGYDPFLTSLTVNSFTVASFFIIWILFTVVDFNDGYSSSSSSASLLYNMTLSSSSS